MDQLDLMQTTYLLINSQVASFKVLLQLGFSLYGYDAFRLSIGRNISKVMVFRPPSEPILAEAKAMVH